MIVSPTLARAFRTVLMCSVAGVAMLPVAAMAQDDSGATTTPEIVVTGSRIPQPNLTSTSPVALINSQEFKDTGDTRVEDVLNSLPAVFASQGSALSNGADGTASVDLRGLGTTRTLALVNGRRIVPGDPSPTSGSAADINIIPAAVLNRVEVLTGGASSVYGADAVAGVVNFIVDTNFTGLRLSGQYSVYQHDNGDKFLTPLQTAAGYPYPKGSATDGGTIDMTAMFGMNSPDDRGHVMGYFGYRKVDKILQANRDYSSCVLQNSGGGAPKCGGSATTPNGNALVFDSSVTTGTSTFYTFTPGGGFENGLSPLYNYGPLNYFQRNDKRYTGGLFANYEINDKIKPYLEFMFMDNSTTAQIAPSGDFANSQVVNCDNPLMSAAQSAVVCAPDNLINGFLGTFPLAQSAAYNPNPGAAPITFYDALGNTYNEGFFQLLRRNVEGGPRRGAFDHTTYRVVFGTKGDLDQNWSYDTYYQYGRVNYSQIYSNEFSLVRLNRALNVVTDTRAGSATFGDAVCRSVIDGTDVNCVPYNVFAGAGGASQAAVNYLSATGFQNGYTAETVINGSLTGDLGGYGVRTPWAKDGTKVNFGIEYRKEELNLQTDEEFTTGDLTGQGAPTLPTSGNFDVVEGFGEAEIPLIQDGIVYDFSLNAGYRYSSYETSAGGQYNTNTYKIGGQFAPIPDIRLRGSYNQAVRAPNIQELFSTPYVGLDGTKDPCAGHPITATEYGCIATGLAVGQGTPANPAGQYNALLGGVPTLKPETAKTWTVGAVFQPRMVPNLAVTIDYYDIQVNNAIREYGPDAILSECVQDATASFTPASCGLVHRNVAGSLWLTPDGYTSNLPGNVGSVETTGLEFSATYNYDLGQYGNLSASFDGTDLRSYEVNNGLTALYDCAGLYGPTCSTGGTTDSGAPLPTWRHKARVTWDTPYDASLSLQWRHIGSVMAETLSSYTSLASSSNFGPGLHIPAYDYFDLVGAYTFHHAYTLRVGVNNIFDKQPPYVTSGNANVDGTNLCPLPACNGNTYPGTYDALGRYIFSNLTLDF